MRFIHIADVHLGAVPDKDKSWSKERADEIESTFDRLLTVAEERKVELLLIAGDLFHAPPSLQELKSLDYKLSKLTNTRTVMIAGNHDYIGKGSPAESYEFTSNTVLMPADTFSNAYLDDINVCVTGFSFGQVEYTEDVYADIMPQMKDAINILLAHGGDEKHIPINFRRMAEAGFDYCALGHIHKPKHIVKNKMAYPGSLEPLDRTETGRHGFIYGQIKDGETKIRWEPFNCRSYINLGFAVKPEYSGAKILDILAKQMESMGTQNIYRIILSGHMANGLKLDFFGLMRNYRIYEIVDNTLCVYDLDKLYLDNEDNLLGQFIDRFAEADDEISKRALKYGVEAILATGDK